MNDLAPRSKTAWLVALVQRRSRRGWWVYVIWLLVYLFTAMMYAGEIAFHSGVMAVQMWPLVIPVLIVIAQWVRPTMLGWAVICLPTFLYFVVGVYYLVRNNLGPHPQWEHDSGGVILGSFFLAALLAACIALMFAARPRVLHETRAA
jgi:hypothetical protein